MFTIHDHDDEEEGVMPYSCTECVSQEIGTGAHNTASSLLPWINLNIDACEVDIINDVSSPLPKPIAEEMLY